MKYLSLYEYLGKPVRRTLGVAVSKAARHFKITMMKRKTSKYYVCIYPESFLEFYFKHVVQLPD